MLGISRLLFIENGTGCLDTYIAIPIELKTFRSPFRYNQERLKANSPGKQGSLLFWDKSKPPNYRRIHLP
jgi:hypothetical protein